jgi:hypothetical protein
MTVQPTTEARRAVAARLRTAAVQMAAAFANIDQAIIDAEACGFGVDDVWDGLELGREPFQMVEAIENIADGLAPSDVGGP